MDNLRELGIKEQVIAVKYIDCLEPCWAVRTIALFLAMNSDRDRPLQLRR